MAASKDAPGDTAHQGEAAMATPSVEVRRDVAPPLEVAWQVLWLRISALPWRSVALVPTGASLHARHAMGFLHAAAQAHPAVPLDSLDATVDNVASLETLAAFRLRRGYQRLVVAVPEPASAPHAVALARAADVAVVVIPMGSQPTRDARLVMNLVGMDRFVGCITLDATGRGRYS
jgi:hypothetical protein